VKALVEAEKPSRVRCYHRATNWPTQKVASFSTIQPLMVVALGPKPVHANWPERFCTTPLNHRSSTDAVKPFVEIEISPRSADRGGFTD
jgi:hypothetical protein